MADTAVASGLSVSQWDDKFFKEYVQENPFKDVMGTDENSIIQVKEDLTKKKGDKIHFALVNRLTNNATLNNATLEGNEEDLTSRSHELTVNKRRHAVRIPEMEEQRSAIPLRDAAKGQLKVWSMEDTRDLVIEALGSINGTAFASADNTARSAWLVDNADRVLFGAAKSNASSLDFATALATVDNSADKLTPGALSLMKRIALSATPRIRPITVAGMNRRYYTVYVNPQSFRDLKENTTLVQAQREVALREENNRLFEGGDLYWDGMIIKEVDDIGTVTNSNSVACGPVYLCGAQALGMGWAKRWNTKTKEFDYGDKYGVAVEGIFGIEKLTFGSGNTDTADLKDHGVVTGWFAAVADA